MADRAQELWQRVSELDDEFERLQAEIRSLEDTIAEDELGAGLLEDNKRNTFLDMRDSYQRRINSNRQQLALLEEQRLANRLEHQQLQTRLAVLQSRLQAAE